MESQIRRQSKLEAKQQRASGRREAHVFRRRRMEAQVQHPGNRSAKEQELIPCADASQKPSSNAASSPTSVPAASQASSLSTPPTADSGAPSKPKSSQASASLKAHQTSCSGTTTKP